MPGSGQPNELSKLACSEDVTVRDNGTTKPPYIFHTLIIRRPSVAIVFACNASRIQNSEAKQMKQRLFKVAIPLTFGLLALGITTAQQPAEAPAGFDGLTNGSVPQNVMNDASATFQEIETVSPSGLGPTYNDTSCVNCHQNQAVGGASQVTVLRAGHNDGSRPESFRAMRHAGDTNGSSGTFVAATAITGNGTPIPNRSLINQRAICADAQEHLTDVDNIRSVRLSLPIFGDGFVEAVPDATFLALAKANGGEAIQVPVLEASASTTEVGKFGLKDQHASLLSFASDAYLNEMGVTNALNPEEITTVCNPTTGVPSPNDTGDDIGTFTTFMRALKVPPRGSDHGRRYRQARLFSKASDATAATWKH